MKRADREASPGGPSALTEAQHDGLACIDCGTETARVMIPVIGRLSKHGSQLFRCNGCFAASRLRDAGDAAAE